VSLLSSQIRILAERPEVWAYSQTLYERRREEDMYYVFSAPSRPKEALQGKLNVHFFCSLPFTPKTQRQRSNQQVHGKILTWPVFQLLLIVFRGS